MDNNIFNYSLRFTSYGHRVHIVDNQTEKEISYKISRRILERIQSIDLILQYSRIRYRVTLSFSSLESLISLMKKRYYNTDINRAKTTYIQKSINILKNDIFFNLPDDWDNDGIPQMVSISEKLFNCYGFLSRVNEVTVYIENLHTIRIHKNGEFDFF